MRGSRATADQGKINSHIPFTSRQGSRRRTLARMQWIQGRACRLWGCMETRRRRGRGVGRSGRRGEARKAIHLCCRRCTRRQGVVWRDGMMHDDVQSLFSSLRCPTILDHGGCISPIWAWRSVQLNLVQVQHLGRAFDQVNNDHIVHRHILIRDELDGFLRDQTPNESRSRRQ